MRWVDIVNQCAALENNYPKSSDVFKAWRDFEEQENKSINAVVESIGKQIVIDLFFMFAYDHGQGD